MEETIPVKNISRKVYLIRGSKIMLDRDLAELYSVETKVLKQAVRRNRNRFPNDFMFELTKKEVEFLRSHLDNKKSGKGQHPKNTSLAFTEQGVAMLSSVLKSNRAVQVNVQIVRAHLK